MKKWYYVTLQKTHQEFMEDEASGLIQSGAIQPSTLIWNESMSDWKPAREVMPQWFESAGSEAPATTAPPVEYPSSPAAATAPSTASATGAGLSQGSGSPSPGGLASSPPALSTTPRPDPLAITSMIAGITGVVFTFLSCILGCFGILAFLGAVTGVITGHMSLSHLKKAGDTVGGRGMAMTGLICGYATLALIVIGTILALVFGIAAGTGAFDNFDQM